MEEDKEKTYDYAHNHGYELLIGEVMNVRKLILGLLDAAVKIAFIVVVVMLISKYSKVAYNYGYNIFNQIPVSSGVGRTVTVTISSADNVNTIADKLANSGLITDKTLFKLQEKFSDYQGLETPGTYELSTTMTTEQMLQIMAAGSTEVLGESVSNSEEGASVESNAGEESSSD